MTKTEFIKKLAEKQKITLAKAEKELNTFFEILVEGLKEDNTVRLYGLGKFELKTTKERVGRNPKNGKEYMIPSLKMENDEVWIEKQGRKIALNANT